MTTESHPLDGVSLQDFEARCELYRAIVDGIEHKGWGPREVSEVFLQIAESVGDTSEERLAWYRSIASLNAEELYNGMTLLQAMKNSLEMCERITECVNGKTHLAKV